jgi:hypothetical protein
VAHVDLESAADQLYGASREEFTALRKELAKAARAAGDAETAAEIDKLAKPTTAAWLANQLARVDEAAVRELAELGDALRDATERLAGAELKSLSQERTERIRTLIRRAGSVSGQALSESVTRELEEIFTVAVADPDVARALVAGRMTSARGIAVPPSWPMAPAGTGPATREKAPARQRSAERAGRAERTGRDGRAKAADADEARDARRAEQLERARKELEEARAAVKEAESARAEEERALEDTQAAADRAGSEVLRLTEELEAAEAREKEARRAIAAARRAVKDAERTASQAWREVQLAERRLAVLGED